MREGYGVLSRNESFTAQEELAPIVSSLKWSGRSRNAADVRGHAAHKAQATLDQRNRRRAAHRAERRSREVANHRVHVARVAHANRNEHKVDATPRCHAWEAAVVHQRTHLACDGLRNGQGCLVR